MPEMEIKKLLTAICEKNAKTFQLDYAYLYTDENGNKSTVSV